jgi:SAM-dependent methyltransferase
MATLGGLAAVLDPEDSEGTKNRLIDRLHKRALAKAIGQLDGKRVLDFGCGNGRISSWLRRQGASVHGLDSSPEMLALARIAVPDGRFDLVEGDELPVEDSPYDLVVSVGVLLYLAPVPERLERVVRKLARAMTPHGQLIALEQVQYDASLGRGAPMQVYRRAFAEAGLEITRTSPVRRSDSRVFRFAARRRTVSRLPWTPALVGLAARKRPGAGAYSEFCWSLTRQGSPATQQ